MTKIKHTNNHVYSISRHAHASVKFYLFLIIYFQPLILRYSKTYSHARHGKPLAHMLYILQKKFATSSRQYQT